MCSKQNRLCLYLNVCYVVCTYVFYIFFSVIILLLLCLLVGDCPHWQPDIAVIIVQSVIDVCTWLINSLYVSLFSLTLYSALEVACVTYITTSVEN